MRHDSRASLLARNLATPCFGREPKARVTTTRVVIIYLENNAFWSEKWTFDMLESYVKNISKSFGHFHEDFSR
jgi:hypothetical protein